MAAGYSNIVCSSSWQKVEWKAVVNNVGWLEYCSWFYGWLVDMIHVSWCFNPLAPGRCGSNFKIVISNTCYRLSSSTLLVKLLSGECHWTPLVSVDKGNGLVPSLHYLNEMNMTWSVINQLIYSKSYYVNSLHYVITVKSILDRLG